MSDSTDSDLVIRMADWSNPEDRSAVVYLLDAYAEDPMGGAAPLSAFAKEHLPATMAATPGAFSVIGFQTGNPVALANCFTTLSTFACKPIVNIHDLAVLPQSRGSGIGQQILSFVEEHARQAGACKITLEVLTGNDRARRSYSRFGFEAYTLDDTSGHALFLQKGI
ncbi:MAG: ribosomal protein S18 acetylase RimI-like enzyme [bacterium]|jgi:ribosomal protein S18 acetylase RimI-like enzyme